MKLKLYIAALCFLGLLLINNHLWGLTETSEARYAEISKEMFENNTLAHPTLLGIYHYHKPPFTYQITTIGYQLFGVNEFGARFFLQISFLIQIILVYLIAFRLFPIKKTALIAALLYASSPIAIMASKNLTTDSYLTTWVLLSIYSWLQAKSKHPYYTFLFYGAIAMGFLTKGPLVLLPVLLFIGSWKLIKKEKPTFNGYHIIGLLIFFGLTSIWYVKIIMENPKILDYFIKDQLVQRVVSKNAFNRGKPFWFYLVLMPLVALPWLPFIGYLTGKKFKASIAKRNEKSILIIATLAIILLFSIFKTKLIFYILPCFPLLAILGASIFTEATDKQLEVFNKVSIIYGSLIGVAFIVLPFFPSLISIPLWVPIIYLVVFGISIYFSKTKELVYRGVLTTLGIAITLLIIAPSVLSKNEETSNSMKPIANFINSIDKGHQLYIFNDLLPSLQFYTNQKIVTLNNGHNLTQREVQFQKDETYKTHLFDLNSSRRYRSNWKTNYSNTKRIIVVKTKRGIPEELSFLTENLPYKKTFKKWTVYYE